MSAHAGEGYNERLFERGGLRQRYHLARYHWFERMMRAHAPGATRVVELGSFDAKTVDFMPNRPTRYVGLDANWEGGLEIGRARFAGCPEIELIETLSADALDAYEEDTFEVAVALETLEHLPDRTLQEYLAGIARVTRDWFFISVPNEMGPVFAAKHLTKRLRYGSTELYTPAEFFNALLFRPERVTRDEHKGFDWRRLVEELRTHFDIISVSGVPPILLPPSLSLTVGIVARPRKDLARRRKT